MAQSKAAGIGGSEHTAVYEHVAPGGKIAKVGRVGTDGYGARFLDSEQPRAGRQVAARGGGADANRAGAARRGADRERRSSGLDERRVRRASAIDVDVPDGG